jgi:geranylgeranyl diphosphate synthase type I
MTMALSEFTRTFLPIIETELQDAVKRADEHSCTGLYQMMAYHMGWEGEGAGEHARGKRIRPLLTLLVAASAGGEPRIALPAACAIELIHNFSLIHDDIEDNSLHRRGRPTVWNIWGIAQATNTGDAMFILAHLELLRLRKYLPDTLVLDAAEILQKTCLHLTQGQYLDISYERRTDLTEADYWIMIHGKTGALLSTSAELGALTASAPEPIRMAYKKFGLSLGLAFQVKDDLLGIWGDSNMIGKSTSSDLVNRKKSLPILFGLQKQGKFHDRWTQGPITPEEADAIATLLESEGARAFASEYVDKLTNQALEALSEAQPVGPAAKALLELTDLLVHRQT